MIECPHTHQRPEDFGPFFEKLDSLGIRYGQVNQALAKFDDKQLLPLVADLRTLFPIWQYESKVIASPYSFLANSGLSGLRGDPQPAIRLPPVDSLARFAVLYADTVFIQEPLSEARFSSSGFPGMRDKVAVELAIMVALKPLLQAGIVKIARNNFPIFGTDPEELNRVVNKVVSGASEKLRERFGSDVKFNVTYVPESKLRMSIAEGPLDLIENPSTKVNRGALGRFTLGVVPPRASQINDNGVLTIEVDSSHPEFSVLFEELISDITRDLSFVAACSLLYDLNYITDRTADFIALESSNSESNVHLNRSLLESFSHEMPIVFGAPLNALLKLRRDDWEAFKVYRDALREALRTVETDKSTNAKVVFNDIVLPELNRIDLLLKRNKKLLSKAALRDAFFTAGAVSIGLLTGFVSPQIADAIAKLGGLKYGIDTARNVAGVFGTPKEAQDNRYFFLWKARRAMKTLAQ